MKFKNNNNLVYIGEFIGSFFISFNFIWAIILIKLEILSVVTAALSWVVSYSIFNQVMDNISNSSFNPTTALLLLLNDKIEVKMFINYCVLQILSSILSGYIVYNCLTSEQIKFIAKNENKLIVNNYFVIFIMVILSSFVCSFLYCQLYVNKNKKIRTGYNVAVGLIYGGFFNLLFDITGGCLNISHILGISIFFKTIENNIIISLIGNILGSYLAGILNKKIFYEENEMNLEKE